MIHITLSEKADSIKVIGQNHTTLSIEKDTCSIEYMMKPQDTYARITAYFQGGEVIYTNPFARYDSSAELVPSAGTEHEISIILTILYNLLVLALLACTGSLLIKTIRK